jgi:TonB family protein
MSNTLARAHEQLPGSDRRSCLRQSIRSLAYVELDEGNGGIILNLSEGGLAVQAVTSLMEDLLPSVRFQLAETESWIRANARITWTSESRKLAGLEFISLSDESRDRIREWLSRESLPGVLEDTGVTATASAEPAVEPSDAHEAVEFAVQPQEPVPAPEFPAPEEAFAAEVVEFPSGPPKIEEASHVLADLLASVSDRAKEAAPTTNTWSTPQPATRKPVDARKLIENNWSTLTLLLFLAVVSLAAGWAAGEGALGRYLGNIRVISSRHGSENRPAATASAGLGARPAEIEVVSASDQRWTIPFNGPLNTPTEANRRQNSASTSSTYTRKPDTGFRTWILSPPQQTRSAPVDDGGVKEAPPLLSENQAAGENVLTSTGALGPHAVAGTPTLPVPAAPTPTGIVKQGQLIHRFDPIYPTIAQEQHAEGTVRLNVTVGPDGIVRGVALLGGPRLLVDAAEKAVRQWRYTPTLLDGKPVEFQREVDLTFRLASVAH